MNFKTFIASLVSFPLCLQYTTCFGLHWPSSGVNIALKNAALLYLLFLVSCLLSEV
jgi:hypothetical protein